MLCCLSMTDSEDPDTCQLWTEKGVSTGDWHLSAVDWKRCVHTCLTPVSCGQKKVCPHVPDTCQLWTEKGVSTGGWHLSAVDRKRCVHTCLTPVSCGQKKVCPQLADTRQLWTEKVCPQVADTCQLWTEKGVSTGGWHLSAVDWKRCVHRWLTPVSCGQKKVCPQVADTCQLWTEKGVSTGGWHLSAVDRKRCVHRWLTPVSCGLKKVCPQVADACQLWTEKSVSTGGWHLSAVDWKSCVHSWLTKPTPAHQVPHMLDRYVWMQDFVFMFGLFLLCISYAFLVPQLFSFLLKTGNCCPPDSARLCGVVQDADAQRLCTLIPGTPIKRRWCSETVHFDARDSHQKTLMLRDFRESS